MSFRSAGTSDARRCHYVVALLLLTATLWLGDASVRAQSEIRSDERVVFFPSVGRRAADGAWVVNLHGQIFEPEEGSRSRAALLAALSRTLGVVEADLDAPSRHNFERRVRAFVVDNERGKRLAVRFGEHSYRLRVESAANGHFEDVLELSAQRVAELVDAASGAARLGYGAVTAPGDPRVFSGHVELVQPTGLSIISDIDDTVKITEVTRTPEMLRNTFLRDFRAVPGMAALYRRWAEEGASLHWVSSSPWQLYEALSGFLRREGFPQGSFHLKLFRLKDSTLLDLFASSEETKPRAMEPLFRAYPGRRFRLVGDSGEHDPEVYGAMARKYPQQVEGIFIRNVTGSIDAARYEAAFQGVPRARWRVFRTTEEL